MFAMSRHKVSGSVDHTKPPPNLDFLLILSEFSPRLLMVDRCGERGVLPFLFKQLPEGQFKQIQQGKFNGWEPLLAYFRVTQPNKGGVITHAGGVGKKRGAKGQSPLHALVTFADAAQCAAGEQLLGALARKVPRSGSEGGSGGSEAGSPPAEAPVLRRGRSRKAPQVHEV